MYSVISVILGIVTTIFTGYCLSGYYDSFVEQKKCFGKHGKYLLTIVFVVTDYILDHCFPTETAEGAKHKECTVCKKVLETATIPATGSSHTHSYGTDWKYDDTNHWHECECSDKADIAAHSASE